MVGSGFVIGLSTHNTEIDMAMSTWLRLARCGALSLSRQLSNYADLVLFYVTIGASLITPVILIKKLLFLRKR